ncbi:MAG TPA: hormogonium polysaccharide biosynthesis glycosyltransferase HpsE [Crinalium sp.]
MKMVEFTVAIPTYNGEHRLPDVLERLRTQTDIDGLSWEVIVVDNNSQDKTAKVVRDYQADFPCPIHYVLERQQGAAFARKRAVREAQSELIGFLDDDNLPAPNWVASAIAFAQSHPRAGAFGSRIHGDFEVEPPHELQHLIPFLAITERGAKPLLYEPKKKLLPPSAGLVVRRDAWSHVPQHTILSGRVDGNMLTGEDLEAISYIQRAGWEIWYNAQMEIIHKIPRWRLERDYLLAFFRGIGLGRYVTRMLGVDEAWRRPLMLAAYTLNDLRKVVMHLLKYRGRVKTDLAAACEWELFVSSLISPLYLYFKGYLKKPELIPEQAPNVKKTILSQTLF